MSIGRAEQDAVGLDDGHASAVFEQAQVEVKEQDFGLPALGRQGRVHVGGVNGAFEGRVGATKS
jgi:hypothetical protein